MDMNPFANNQPPSGYQTPDYLKQDPKNGTGWGAMSNMVKALMDGNNKFQARQAPGGVANAQPGAPMSLAPDNPGASAPMPGSPSPMAPSPAMASGSPFDQGTSALPFTPAPGMIASNGAGSGMPGLPNGNDPTINALFSPIPGGQFGG